MLFQAQIVPHAVPFAYDVTILNATAVSGGFSGAAVFKATTSDGRLLAIRRTPKSVALPPERMKKLHGLLQQMSQSGCQLIPVPLMPARAEAQNHGGKHRSAVPWLQVEGNLWQIEPWMPGSSLDGHQLTGLHLRAALIALNQFHQVATEAIRIVGSNDWFLNATRPSPGVLRRLWIVAELREGLLQELQDRLRADSDERFRYLAARVCQTLTLWLPWLQSELTALAVIPFAVQPVLRDIWRAHVLFKDCEVTGLIDLSATASDHVTIDLARLLRSWFGADISSIRNAIDEYQSRQILTSTERRLLQTLDASTVLLSPVTWLRRRLESGDSETSSGDVIARLTELTDVAETFQPLFAA